MYIYYNFSSRKLGLAQVDLDVPQEVHRNQVDKRQAALGPQQKTHARGDQSDRRGHASQPRHHGTENKRIPQSERVDVHDLARVQVVRMEQAQSELERGEATSSPAETNQRRRLATLDQHDHNGHECVGQQQLDEYQRQAVIEESR